jgi:hypothetical protein
MFDFIVCRQYDTYVIVQVISDKILILEVQNHSQNITYAICDTKIDVQVFL